MEACGGARFWARKLELLGHHVKLMAPQFVKPYVKTNKNDAADAEAICEAVGRPNMRFVPIKNGEQLVILSVHRARQGFVKAVLHKPIRFAGYWENTGSRFLRVYAISLKNYLRYWKTLRMIFPACFDSY